jgi:uncharacterized protein YdeI (BOF family)
VAISAKSWGIYGGIFAAGAVTVAAVGWVAGAFGGNTQGAVLADPQSSASQVSESAAGVTPIANLQRNQVVTIQGVVEAIRDEDEFVLNDSTGSVTVWTGGMMFPVQPGETLTVTGFVDNDIILEVYAQEIIRESGEVTSVTRPQDGSAGTPEAVEAPQSTPASDLTAIGSLVRGTFVTIAGSVERVTDEDEFILRDNTGSVKIWTGEVFFPVNQGDQVTVQGFVDEDLLLEVYAQEIITESGEVIVVGGYSSSQ